LGQLFCFWRRLQCGKNLFGVLSWFYLRPNPLDHSIRADQESHPVRAHIFATHEAFLPPDPVRLNDFLVSIRKQWKWKLIFLNKFVVGFRGVDADAQNNRTYLLEGSKFIPEGTRFLRAAWRVVLRVEVQNHVLASEVGEADLTTSISGHGKVRGPISLLERESLLLCHIRNQSNSATIQHCQMSQQFRVILSADQMS